MDYHIVCNILRLYTNISKRRINNKNAQSLKAACVTHTWLISERSVRPQNHITTHIYTIVASIPKPLSLYIYKYIYRERAKERERERHLYTYMYTYINIYIIYIYV